MDLFEVKFKHNYIAESGKAKKKTMILLIKDIETYTEAESLFAEIIHSYGLRTDLKDAVIKKIKVSIRPDIDTNQEHHYLINTEMESLDGSNIIKDSLIIHGDDPGQACAAAPQIVSQDVPASVTVTKAIEYDIDFYSFIDSGSNNRAIFTRETSVAEEENEVNTF